MSDDDFKTHPMEELFDIEEGTTHLPSIYEDKPSVKPASYDDKENEIDDQFQEIYNEAMKAFKMQQEDAQIIDPQFRARNQEVSVQLLSTALNAANAKANLKQTKEKMEISKNKGARTVNNNLIVDRNSLLDMLNKEEMGEVYDSTDHLISGDEVEDGDEK